MEATTPKSSSGDATQLLAAIECGLAGLDRLGTEG